MKDFEIIVCSVPDREHLVAEIWFGGVHIAEISREHGELEIGFSSGKEVGRLPFGRFVAALEEARGKLQGSDG